MSAAGQPAGGSKVEERETQLKPWTVTASRYLLQDKWLTVRADHCRTELGVVVEPYYVLEYPDWVQVVAFDSDSHVLVTQQYRHAARRVCLELPCGVVEADGETPLEAARRELLEETGCTSDRFESIGHFSPNPATHTNTVHCFAAYDVRRSRPVSQDAAEEVASAFLLVQDVLAAIDTGQVAQALHISGLMLGLKHAGLLTVSDKPNKKSG